MSEIVLDRVPLVPVMLSPQKQYGNWVQVAVTVKVEFALPPDGTDKLVGFSFGVSPLGPEVTTADRLTVPENPLTLATVIMS